MYKYVHICVKENSSHGENKLIYKQANTQIPTIMPRRLISNVSMAYQEGREFCRISQDMDVIFSLGKTGKSHYLAIQQF